MRALVMLASSAAAVLAACTPPAPNAQAPAIPSVFPDLFQTAYRVEANMIGEDGSIMPMVMIRDGHKMRMEMSTAEGPIISVVNNDTGETFVITHAAGRQIVMRQPADQAQQTPDQIWAAHTANARQVGPCSHIGEAGVEWELAGEGGPQHSCITGDGLMLWATDNGRTTWTTTGITRGAQDAALFTMPEGARVVRPGQLEAEAAAAIEQAEDEAAKDQ